MLPFRVQTPQRLLEVARFSICRAVARRLTEGEINERPIFRRGGTDKFEERSGWQLVVLLTTYGGGGVIGCVPDVGVPEMGHIVASAMQGPGGITLVSMLYIRTKVILC